ncbi:hypothetical protein [Glycomyces artemisiae]|uniref:MORN repeat protein n=1 Tax=Glycomyces artemisiae TaxID=1076443 RepID=A0A2T0UR70_9ACTN|nr:hypothetical protein [Glycomyces artemisiae]PRY60432.1 hypothetical protein B0I28_10236 [Glycomyces artemisiae]
MKPNYDPVALTVPDDEVEIDDELVYRRGSERFTGFTGRTRYGGNYEFQSFKDGLLDGPSGEITPEGDLVVEEWYRGNFLYGITRKFRQDGTLATAIGYEYGFVVWTVKFDFDGSSVTSTELAEFDETQMKTLGMFRRELPMPPVPGPEYAGDLQKH